MQKNADLSLPVRLCDLTLMRVGGALLAAFASLVLWPALVRGAEDSCRLTPQQKVTAVKAFKALAPIYQDPRCLNCHGAVNPFSRAGGHGGGYIDIREEARAFLQEADLPGALVAPDDAGRATELQGIREVAESRDEITDNDVIRQKALGPMLKACRECHVSDWIMPMSHNFFTGRDWKALCMHMKTSSFTTPPVAFLKHMQGDADVLAGFKGERGLLSPTGAEPPAMPFDTMARHANDWIAAMDAQFYQPPQCGCEIDGIALEIRHRLYTDPGSSSAKAGYAQFDGTVVFDVLLQKMEGDFWYRDEVIVTRAVEVRHVTPSFLKCAGSGKRDEAWIVTARLDEERQSMQLHLSFTEEGEEAEWTCSGHGYSATDKVNIDVHSMIKTLDMSLASGSVGKADQRDVKTIESITVTVIDSPVGQ